MPPSGSGCLSPEGEGLQPAISSTQEGRFLVVPATFPGRQEHLTVCDRSSMRFLLQHLCAAITSHVPPSLGLHPPLLPRLWLEEASLQVKSSDTTTAGQAVFFFLRTFCQDPGPQFCLRKASRVLVFYLPYSHRLACPATAKNSRIRNGTRGPNAVYLNNFW